VIWGSISAKRFLIGIIRLLCGVKPGVSALS
jgi:hypothetical protein